MSSTSSLLYGHTISVISKIINFTIIPYFIYIIYIIIFNTNNVKPYLLYLLLPNLILLFIFIYDYNIYKEQGSWEYDKEQSSWKYELKNKNLFHISTIVSSLIMIYTTTLISLRVFTKNSNTNNSKI